MSPRRRARSGESAVGNTRGEGRGRRGQLYHAVILSTRAPRRDEPPEPAPTRRLPGARRPPVSGAAVLADPGSRRARGRRGAATIRAVAAGQGVGRARAGDDPGIGRATSDPAPRGRPAGRPARGTGHGGAAAPSGEPVATPVRPAPREFVAIPELRDIHFDFDKYDIRPGDARTLDANAAWLKASASQLLLVEGHCDERGTNEYNVALGERRAKAAMNYLVAQGVRANRITVISYGEERPLCTEHNEGCWSQNRRAHFLVRPQ